MTSEQQTALNALLTWAAVLTSASEDGHGTDKELAEFVRVYKDFAKTADPPRHFY